jgi:hypothetical protein
MGTLGAMHVPVGYCLCPVFVHALFIQIYLNSLFLVLLSGTPAFRLPLALYNLHASLKWSGLKGPLSP